MSKCRKGSSHPVSNPTSMFCCTEEHGMSQIPHEQRVMGAAAVAQVVAHNPAATHLRKVIAESVALNWTRAARKAPCCSRPTRTAEGFSSNAVDFIKVIAETSTLLTEYGVVNGHQRHCRRHPARQRRSHHEPAPRCLQRQARSSPEPCEPCNRLQPHWPRPRQLPRRLTTNESAGRGPSSTRCACFLILALIAAAIACCFLHLSQHLHDLLSPFLIL